MKNTIVLADDHPIIRRGLRGLLEAEPDFSIVGEAEDGAGAVRVAGKLQPDVLVLDVLMPGLSGLEVLPIMRQRCPRTRCVMLSMSEDDEFVLAALQSGAAGYILKGSEPTHLVQAIREVVAGRRFLSPSLDEHVIASALEHVRLREAGAQEHLTPREREVLELAARGRTNSEIGRALFLSSRTVEMHRANFMHKLNLRNAVELVRYAIQHGIIPLQD